MQSGHEEHYIHEYQWRAGTRLLRDYKDGGNEGYYYRMPITIMSLFSFESFINFVGFAIKHPKWKNEKEELRGVENKDKLKLLSESINGFNFDAGRDPYQTIGKAFKLREMMAHGKVNRIEHSEIVNFNGFNFDTPWDCMGDLGFVENLRDNIKLLSQELIEACRLMPDHHLHFYHNAFEGPLCSGESRDGG
jgi:hypothetical protein